MKNLNAKDMDQVSGGMLCGAPVTFFCEKCNKTFTTNSGTQYHGICPDCGTKGKKV